MPKPSDGLSPEELLREKILGLGPSSIHKSYYPELQQKLLDLEISEKKYRAVVEASPVGMIFFKITLDNLLVLTGANHVASKIMDINVTANLGKPIVDVLPGLKHQDIAGIYEDIARKGISWHAKDFLYHNENYLGHFEIYAFQPEPEHVAIFFMDITEQIRAEEERNRLWQAVGQTTDSVVIMDNEGTILYTNPAFEKMTGYSSQEALGQNFCQLHIPTEDTCLCNEIFEAMQSGSLWHGQVTCHRKDNSIYKEEINLTPVRNQPGSNLNYIAVSRDITLQLKMEELIMQQQKMDSLGRLAGGVAHDFNNLLTPILGYIDLLLEDEALSSTAKENLKTVQKAAEGAQALTRELLTFSRKQNYELKTVDLRDILADFQDMMRRTVREDIQFSILPGDIPLNMKADASQIKRVILNLALNAQDAMPNGGKITIETRPVELDAQWCEANPGYKPGQYILLSFADTGVGMSKETLTHIYEPFFSTKGEKGTGMGLPTVYGIVNQHAGIIQVQSEPGQGTVFQLYFPREVTERLRPAPLTDQKKNIEGTETILVVEDNEMVRKLACSILRTHGFKTLEAKDGLEGLELYGKSTRKIHLLLTDVVMPRMNGKELFEQLSALKPDIKVLYMSGYPEEIITPHGIVPKGLQFLQKPFTFNTLLEKVREVLDNA